MLECTNVDDMTAILHEGMKHRKIGSHELNKDSSRSHSILTIYLITEVPIITYIAGLTELKRCKVMARFLENTEKYLSQTWQVRRDLKRASLQE